MDWIHAPWLGADRIKMFAADDLQMDVWRLRWCLCSFVRVIPFRPVHGEVLRDVDPLRVAMSGEFATGLSGARLCLNPNC